MENNGVSQPPERSPRPRCVALADGGQGNRLPGELASAGGLRDELLLASCARGTARAVAGPLEPAFPVPCCA